MMFMNPFKVVTEPKPINVSHDTYRRECKYTRGIHIPIEDFIEILNEMTYETRLYFDFHNPGKPIMRGTYLNGHSSLARTIAHYYENVKCLNAKTINNGKDFYVKLL